MMRGIFYGIMGAFLLTSASSGFAESSIKERIAKAAEAPSYEQDRMAVRAATRETLDRLYQVRPGARNTIKNAAGYAVFSNFGMKIFVAGGGKGKGMAVNNKTGKEVFMKMLEVQAGLGMGIKKFRLVWIFDTQNAFDHFVDSGWELGAQATAAAQIKDVGGAHQGALAIAPGVWLYQLTDNGLALELTAKGTKYYKDKELN